MNKLKIHKEIEQNTPEWHILRDLRFSASEANAIATNGAGLRTLAFELWYRHTFPDDESFTGSTDTERGHEIEPMCRNMYELETGKIVEQVGYIEIDEHIGFSPDGLVGKKGGFEAKSINKKLHSKLVLGIDEIEKTYKKYVDQCQFSLLYGKRDWWDLCFYNPDVKKSLIIHRVKPDLERQQEIIVGVNSGITLLKSYIKKYEKC